MTTTMTFSRAFEQKNKQKEENFNMAGEDMKKLFGSFNMQKKISDILLFCVKVNDEIAKPIGKIAQEDASFESVVMDLLEEIARLNKHWCRQDAIKEAAKELIVARLFEFSAKTIAVYERALIEFKRATDDEYNFLRRKIFG